MKEPLADCIALMEALIEYRQKPVSNDLQQIRHKSSMLHLDVLTLIYYFAATGWAMCSMGPYLGGSTIAAVLGVRASPNPEPLSIEPGGQHSITACPAGISCTT